MNKTGSKIALGTVQFGFPYGINNKNGMPDQSQIEELLLYASKCGINILDTAFSYGNSEEKIGRFLASNKSVYQIISKAPKNSNSENVEKYFNKSLDRLNLPHLYGYLIHDFNDYLNNKKILNKLTGLKEKGKVKKIGFSLYYPEQLEELLKDDIEFDLVQVPYNLADRRFQQYFEVLKGLNVEIHTRSVFLQGLFFMDPSELPSKLLPFKELLSLLIQLSKETNETIEFIALNFVMQNELINKVVLGIDNIDQLKKNIIKKNTFLSGVKLDQLTAQIEKIHLPVELLVPSNWN